MFSWFCFSSRPMWFRPMPKWSCLCRYKYNRVHLCLRWQLFYRSLLWNWFVFTIRICWCQMWKLKYTTLCDFLTVDIIIDLLELYNYNISLAIATFGMLLHFWIILLQKACLVLSVHVWSISACEPNEPEWTMWTK